VAGQGDGGFGWGANWSNGHVATNTSAGLSYNNGGALVTSAGGVVLGYYPGTYPSSGAINGDGQRLLPDTFGNLAVSGELWVSVLFNFQTTGTLTAYREAKMGFFSGATATSGVSQRNGSERLDFGVPHTYNAGASDTLTIYSGSTYVSSGIATPRNANLSLNTVFMVIQVQLDGTTAADTANMWINPSLTSPLGTADATWTATDLDAINAIRFQIATANASGTNQCVEFDELRVGTSFADVAPIPEPVTIALASLGGLMFLALRRRS
jgi:hypothetical protein